MKVVVIGSGVGGLCAASRLARLGHDVLILEARAVPGGLASGFDHGRLSFDGGPYILLDRPGLEWALERIGFDVASLQLIPVENLYEVVHQERSVRVFLDESRTSEELEREWPGSGHAYAAFVEKMEGMRRRLAPLLRVPHPNLMELARRGSLSAAPFLLRSLSGVLRDARLPPEVVNAIAIWTHIAGQELESAPSVMAFIPALIHRVGAFVPAGGMRVIPERLAAHAVHSGVEIRYQTAAQRIRAKNGRVTGVELSNGEVLSCDAVVSNYHGVGTYDQMVEVPERVRKRLRRLRLQSPGMCAYVSASGDPRGSYLRFLLDAQNRVRLRVSPSSIDAAPRSNEKFPLRLIAPIDHDAAIAAGENGQNAELQRMVSDPWWRDGITEAEVLASRTVRGWGREMGLYRDSMNPAMTRRLMLRGRLAHRSPWVRGLYLAGSSTHPGQWVSFCAISGILAADALSAEA